MTTNGQTRKQTILIFLFVLLTIPFTGRGQPVMKLLLQHLNATPSDFKEMATSELKFSFGFTNLLEGGLIGEDTFRKDGITLVKSYGYYALRNSADRQLRKRLGLTQGNRSNWRDSSWNGQRERDWTGITLSTASDSIAGALLQEAMTLGAREVEPCLHLKKVNDVTLEEKMYTLSNVYKIVFRKYGYPKGVQHEVTMALCSFD